MHSLHHSTIQPQQPQSMPQFQPSQQAPSQSQPNQQDQEQQVVPTTTTTTTTMTVLETLEPVLTASAPQPPADQGPTSTVANSPAATTTGPPQTANTIHHHHPHQLQQHHQHLQQTQHHHHQLVQAGPPTQQQQQQQPPPPHLHQLQAPPNRCTNLLEVNEHLLQQQENHQMHQHEYRPTEDTNNDTNNNSKGRQRPQIEGIVAEGGGPIVQWLLDNYEIADGESLPRSTVYNHYLAHCRQLQMSSVNAASFGKLIRSVFVGLKTRRLGTRGHSKYHYFGVRAKQHVRLDWVQQQHQHQHEQDHEMATAGSSRDLNENSNQNTDNGSESDSTGGRLSSSGIGGGGGGGSSSGKRMKRISTNNDHSYIQTTDNNNNGANDNHQFTHQIDATDPGLSQANGFYYSNGSLDGYEINNHNDHHHHHHQQQHHHHPQHLNNHSDHHHQHHAHPHHHHHHHHHHHQANHHKHLNGAPTANGGDLFVWPLDHCHLSLLRSHLGSNWASLVDDNWPQSQAVKSGLLDGDSLMSSANNNEDANLLEVFEANYKTYYKRMVELLSELKFAEVEQLWFDFWHPTPKQTAVAAAKQTGETIHWTSTTTGSNPDANSLENNENQSVMVTTLMSNGQQQQETPHQHQQEQEQQQNGHHHLQNQMDYQQQQLTTTLAGNSLAFNQLYQLTSQRAVIERVNEIDYRLYAAIESFLLPDMISDQIPQPLNQNIRMFAELIGTWIELAIKDYAPQFVAEKSRSARAFGHALRRYASINHLAVVSRAIWDKRPILVQMGLDLSRIDLRDIEQQVYLMNQTDDGSHMKTTIINNTPADPTMNGGGGGGCDSVGEATDNDNNDCTTASGKQAKRQLDPNQQENNENSTNNNQTNRHSSPGPLAIQPAQLVENLLHLLKEPYPAGSWPEWCRSLVDSSCLLDPTTAATQRSSMVSSLVALSHQEARDFILKWNFYINLIMKELTLKSAPSLASFQLIRLLFDEYMYYLVVSKLARMENKTLAQLLTPTTGAL